jgi:predicted small integral membrane protein
MNLEWMVGPCRRRSFVVIAFMLAGTTVWQIVAPSPERRGFADRRHRAIACSSV